MKQYMVLVLFVQIILRLDAQITISTINSAADAGTFNVGSEVIVMCEIQPYAVFMNWKINSGTVAECTFTTCSPKSSLPGHYKFSHNTGSGIFNLTINPVQSSDDGYVLICENENGADRLEVTVKVSGVLDGSNGNGICWLCIFLPIFGVVIIAIVIIILVIKGKPKPVKGFSVKNVTGSSFTVTWETDSKWCCRKKYILSRKCLADGKYSRNKLTQKTKVHENNDLSAETLYKLVIHEKSLVGQPGQQSTLVVKTRGKEQVEPTNNEVASNDVTESSITVKWKPGDNGRIFVLEYSESHQDNTFNHGHDYKGQIRLLWETSHGNGNEIMNQLIPLDSENKNGSLGKVGPANGELNPPTEFGVVSKSVKESSIEVERNQDDGKASLLHYTLKPLKPATYYNLQIYTENENETSEKATLSPVRTNGKPEIPTGFKVVSKCVESITVEWKRGSDGGFPQAFIITVSEEGKVDYEIAVLDNEETSLLHSTLKNLKPTTNYALRIFAGNEKGISQQSDPLRVRTYGKPDPPTDFGVVDNGVTESSIAVRWKPGENGGFKQKFTLNCLSKGKQIEEKIIEDKSECQWTELSKGTTYTITILATNQEGSSPKLKPLYIRTLVPRQVDK